MDRSSRPVASAGWQDRMIDTGGNQERQLMIDSSCGPLCATLHVPAEGNGCAVVILVGGRQYKVGAHRQFTKLARHLANKESTVLRFDFPGMGDSVGNERSYTDVNDDIRSAIDSLLVECPEISRVVVWGLCDGASAGAFHAAFDPRISALVMVNPWVESADSVDASILNHYYRDRVFSRVFWTKLLRGRVNIWSSYWSFSRSILGRFGLWRRDLNSMEVEPVLDALYRFERPLLIVLSEKDTTAQAFVESAGKSEIRDDLWARKSVTVLRHESADHTFSCPISQRWLEDQTASWLNDLSS